MMPQQSQNKVLPTKKNYYQSITNMANIKNILLNQSPIW